MTGIAARLSAIGYRRLAFTVVVVALLALITLLMRILLLGPILLWFPDGLGVNPDLGPHRFHAMVISLVTWTTIVGLLSQLRSPRKNVAGHILALLAFVALGLAFALTNYWQSVMVFGILGGPFLIATLLHPSGRAFVSSFTRGRFNRVLFALVLVAAVPLVFYAATQVGLHTGAIQPHHDHGGGGHAEEVHTTHIENGHFVNAAAISFIIIGAGFVASLRPDGWWVPAWYAGVVAILLGGLSLAYPGSSSAFEPVWALGAIAWGLAFIGTAEYTQSAEAPTVLGARGLAPTSS